MGKLDLIKQNSNTLAIGFITLVGFVSLALMVTIKPYPFLVVYGYALALKWLILICLICAVVNSEKKKIYIPLTILYVIIYCVKFYLVFESNVSPANIGGGGY